ncbi:hypothetical protein J4467_02785 [Candidatus Woesearchaeota archaeon]|nr:hypothetical protein [Candidatus Woesearchaeota archaeon]
MISIPRINIIKPVIKWDILIPTLVFTFIIAEMLFAMNYIDYHLYSILLVYGVLTGIISFVVNWLLDFVD